MSLQLFRATVAILYSGQHTITMWIIMNWTFVAVQVSGILTIMNEFEENTKYSWKVKKTSDKFSPGLELYISNKNTSTIKVDQQYRLSKVKFLFPSPWKVMWWLHKITRY